MKNPHELERGSGPVDIAIITTLPEEYEAILCRLTNSKRFLGSPHDRNVSAWQLGEVIYEATGEPYRVVLALSSGPTNTNSPLVTLTTIERWNPEYVFFVGIAAGLYPDKIGKGDIALSRSIWFYDYGKIGERYVPRRQFTYPCDEALHTNALVSLLDWSQIKETFPGSDKKKIPLVKTGIIASGNQVVDNPDHPFFEAVTDSDNAEEIIAVEMEGAGAAAAIEHYRTKGINVHFMMIRGISDMIRSEEKRDSQAHHDERDKWKRYAADTAAVFTIELIKKSMPSYPSKHAIMTGDSQKKTSGIQPEPKFCNIPPLPPGYLPIKRDIDLIKKYFLSQNQQAVGITSFRTVGLQGMGGVGKTILASAVARVPEVRKKFTDGIYWITLGQHPNLVERQKQLCRAMNEKEPPFTDIQGGQAYLSDLLADKTCLIILDDVWETDHIGAFNRAGHSCRMLITTRIRSIIPSLDGIEHNLDLLSEKEALGLLAKRLEREPSSLPKEAIEIVHECGYLPLALAMAGSMIVQTGGDWANILHKLRTAELEKIRMDSPEYPYHDLYKVMQVSIDYLGVDKEFYFDLAVFPEDAHIPPKALETYWESDGLDTYAVKDKCDLFVDHSLALTDDRGRLYLHDLHYDFIHLHGGDLKKRHNKLLTGYRRRCPDGWASCPDDGYFYENFVWHLFTVGEKKAMRRLLLNFDWITMKLDVCGVGALLSDYYFLNNDEIIALVQGAIRLSTSVLVRDTSAIKSQLYGRLVSYQAVPEINSLMVQITGKNSGPWLRTLNPCLNPAGGALISLFRGRTGRIHAIAVSADGKTAVCGSFDKTVMVWDLDHDTDAPEKVLKGHTGWITAVAISADGKMIVSGSEDKTVMVWNPTNDSEKPERILHGHASAVRSVAISADGKTIISGSDDETVIVWNPANDSEKPERILHGHASAVRSVAISADGKTVLSGSNDKMIRVWNLDCLIDAPVKVLNEHHLWLYGITLSADGKKALSCSNDENVMVWNLENDSGEPERILHGHTAGVNSVAISADGKIAVSGSNDKTVMVWDLARDTDAPGKILKGHSEWVNAVAISADGRRAVSGSDDETMMVWDLEHVTENPEESQKAHAGWVNAVAMSADGKKAVSGSADYTIMVWDLEKNLKKPEKILKKHTEWIRSIAISGDGGRIVSGSEDKTLMIWNSEKNSDSPEKIIAQKAWILAVAISADGRKAVSGSNDYLVRVWNLKKKTKTPEKILPGHTSWVRAVSISPDGRRAVSGSFDKTVMVWNLENDTDKPERIFARHTAWVSSVAISADGRRAVSGSEDKTMMVWDLDNDSAMPEKVLKHHDKTVTSVGISADGKVAISGSNDSTIIVWDLVKWKIMTIFYFDEEIKACAISPDNQKIIAGGSSGRLFAFILEGF